MYKDNLTIKAYSKSLILCFITWGVLFLFSDLLNYLDLHGGGYKVLRLAALWLFLASFMFFLSSTASRLTLIGLPKWIAYAPLLLLITELLVDIGFYIASDSKSNQSFGGLGTEFYGLVAIITILEVLIALFGPALSRLESMD